MQFKYNNTGDGTDIDYSVVIGRVSTEDSDRILETLESLHKQEGNPALEILLADRLDDDISARIRQDYPDVHIVKYPPETDLPTMRTELLKHATGRYILVTEDHCVPQADWLQRFSEAFTRYPDAVAVGGCVVNGITDTALDWATFLCEYAPMSPPIEDGPTSNIAGMNIAYRRGIFETVDETILKSGFWETTLHPVLLNRGYLLIADNDIVIYHCKKISLRFFLWQRFIYSRYYAGTRFPHNARIRRLLFAIVSPALPVILCYRFLNDARHKKDIRYHMIQAMPYLLLFYLTWGAGETWGYLSGPDKALQQIE